MIIKKGTKHPITIHSKPNENWLNDNENYIVIDDHSELGIKVLDNAPHFGWVEDVEGNIIDITPLESPPQPPPGPTDTDYLLDLDYRLSKIEIGV